MKKCCDCDKWLPLSEFQKSGKNRFGTPMWRPFCKQCYVVRQSPEYVRTGPPSTCTNCTKIDTCYQILWELIALPCQDANFAMPQSAAWVEVVR